MKTEIENFYILYSTFTDNMNYSGLNNRQEIIIFEHI